MSSRLFNRILVDLCAHDRYFYLKHNAAAGKPRLSPHPKIIAALRQLAYGVGANAMDEYCCIAKSTTLESLYRFVKGIRELYESKYLRKPFVEDFESHLRINEQRGFLGGNNDLNVLDRSPLLNEWLHNNSANVNFRVNRVEYHRAYLLVDSIYPPWSMFIGTIQHPQTEKLKLFTKCQEAARKDVERAFGVLQARFEIVKRSARSWYEKHIINILAACTILHNMIIEDEHGDATSRYLRTEVPQVTRDPLPWMDFLAAIAGVNNRANHFKLRNDIVDHL